MAQTRAQLVEIAEQLGIEVDDEMTKPEIKEAINTHVLGAGSLEESERRAYDPFAPH